MSFLSPAKSTSYTSLPSIKPFRGRLCWRGAARRLTFYMIGLFRSTTGSRRLIFFLYMRWGISRSDLPLNQHPDIICKIAEHVPCLVLRDRPLQSTRKNCLGVQNELSGQGAPSDRPAVFPARGVRRKRRARAGFNILGGGFHLSIGRGFEPQPSHCCATEGEAAKTRAPKRRSRWRETDKAYRRCRQPVGLW